MFLYKFTFADRFELDIRFIKNLMNNMQKDEPKQPRNNQQWKWA